jgi:hypothetical protein
MAKKCFQAKTYGATSYQQPGEFVQSNGISYASWYRANTLSTVVDTILNTDSNPYYAGMQAYFLVIDGVQTRIWGPTWEITEDPNNPNCPALEKYDCINGQCFESTVYSTPGQYETLEACQSECGQCENQCNPPNICVPPNHCPDGYVCIGADEFAAIKRELS